MANRDVLKDDPRYQPGAAFLYKELLGAIIVLSGQGDVEGVNNVLGMATRACLSPNPGEEFKEYIDKLLSTKNGLSNIG